MTLNLTGFSPATTIRSAEMNDNFTAIQELLNGLRPQFHIFVPDIQIVTSNVTAEIKVRTAVPLYFSTIDIRVKTAPTGSALIVNIKKNGTTIFSTKPQISAGATTGGSTAVFAGTNPSLSDGDVLTIDIDQVGSTEPGRDLTIGLAFTL